MASMGTIHRLRRLEGPGGRIFLAALDHGLPAGPLPGLEAPGVLAGRLAGTPISGIVANPGIVRFLGRVADRTGLVVHLSAGTILGNHPTSKVLSRLPEDAFALGADAVSVQIHFGDDSEDRMLADAGLVADEAAALGLPVIAMAYPDVGSPEAALHAVRAAAELGAVLVQTHYTRSAESFLEVVRGCPVPVLVAGGPMASSPEAFLGMVRDAMAAGAGGVTAGRNLFQNPDPARFAVQIANLVFAATPRVATGG